MIALITGASSGIGLAFAEELAKSGFNVILTARREDRLKQLANRLINDYKIEAWYFTADLAQQSGPNKLYTKIKATGLSPDLLINNAGVYGNGANRLGALDSDTWLQTLLINTIATLKIMEALVDNVALSKRKLMAVLSSKMGSMADNSSGGAYAYRSSKAGLNAAVKSAALDLADRGIIALSLHPGWLQTDMGGPNAIHDVAENVGKLRAVLDAARPEHSGQFLDYSGASLPW